MANWRALLTRVRGWLKPGGVLFIHIFTHRHRPARYDWRDPEDWMGQHFFTGGIMPTVGLIRQFPDLFTVEEEWRWNGVHYRRTALQWLEAFDTNRARIDPILAHVYGADASLWRRRWRIQHHSGQSSQLLGYQLRSRNVRLESNAADGVHQCDTVPLPQLGDERHTAAAKRLPNAGRWIAGRTEQKGDGLSEDSGDPRE